MWGPIAKELNSKSRRVELKYDMTTRDNGRTKPNAVEAAFPYVVEMKVPPDGFGSLFNAMLAWHQKQEIEARNGPGRFEGGVSIIRWCFANAETAEAFCAQFGGVSAGPQ